MIKIKKENFEKGRFKAFIIESLKESGVDVDSVDIRLKKDGGLVLSGEVSSQREKAMIYKSVKDVAGIEDIEDDIIVLNDEEGGMEDLGGILDDHDDDGSLYDEDNECVASQDIFRSVEDGVPYIPPTDPSFQDSYSDDPRQRRRSRGRIF
jgi:hypothetical protein